MPKSDSLLVFLDEQLEEIVELNLRFTAMVAVLQTLGPDSPKEAYNNIDSWYIQIRERLTIFLNESKKYPYPFEHRKNYQNLNEYFCGELPDIDNIDESLNAYSKVFDCFHSIRCYTIGHIVDILENCENDIRNSPSLLRAISLLNEAETAAEIDEKMGEISFSISSESNLAPAAAMATALPVKHFGVQEQANLESDDMDLTLEEPVVKAWEVPKGEKWDINEETEKFNEKVAEERAIKEAPVEQNHESISTGDAVGGAIGGKPVVQRTEEIPATVILGIKPMGMGRIDSRYHLTGKIASENLISTYKAYDELAEITLLFKHIKAGDLSVAGVDVKEIQMRVEFLKLNPHNNIVGLFECHKVEFIELTENSPLSILSGDIALTEEFFAGIPLPDFSKQYRLITGNMELYSTMLMKLAAGCDFLAKNNMVSTTLTPNDILISKQKDVKIKPDFFILGLQREENLHTKTYRDQKSAENCEFDASTIQFNLAVIVYELLNGQLPSGYEFAEDSFLEVVKDSLTLTFKAKKVIQKAISSEKFDSCMEFIAELIRSNEVDIDEYFTMEQQEWLAGKNFNTYDQLALIKQIKGVDPKNDSNPQLINDQLLKVIIEDQIAERRADQRLIYMKYCGKAAVIATTCGAVFIWYNADKEACPQIRMEGNKTVTSAFRTGFWNTGMPSKSKIVASPGSRVYFYTTWMGVEKHDTEKVSIVDSKGTSIYNSEEFPIREYAYRYVYITTPKTFRDNNIIFKIFLNNKLIGKQQIRIASPFSTSYLLLITILIAGVSVYKLNDILIIMIIEKLSSDKKETEDI